MPDASLAGSSLGSTFCDDPHPALDLLRQTCPISRDVELGHYYLTRYTDVRRCLTDLSLWKDPEKAAPSARALRAIARSIRPPAIGSGAAERSPDLLLLDPPDHTRIREPIARAFNRRVAAAGPMVERIVSLRLATLNVGGFDVVSNYAGHISVDVIATLLGVGTGDLVQFHGWAEALIKFLKPSRTQVETIGMLRAMRAFAAYLKEQIAVRRKAPGDDLISDLVVAQTQGALLTDDEIRVNLQGLLVGGTLTTADLITSAVWLLLSNPDQQAMLQARPERIKGAIEEALRLLPPIDVTSRIASHTLAFEDHTISRGEALFLSICGANRDPARFVNPHRYDIERDGPPHVAFGGGAHICIGQALARLEARAAVSLLLQRFPNLRLRHPDAAPEWRAMPPFRGLSALDVMT